MNDNDEIQILDELSKGRKGQVTRSRSGGKYNHHRKGSGASSRSPHPERKVSDMLRTAAGKQQAILKITGYYNGKKSKSGTGRHLLYISRDGTLELEDQDANKIITIDEQRELINDWSIDFGSNERNRNVMRLMLSTPPGTDRENARKAAHDFLAAEYGELGHEYVFVAHNDTDHPHIHAAVKMTSCYGKKLNPRKADLHKAREHFAEKCRAYGIDLEASPRHERGLSGKSKKSEFVQMRRYNRKPSADQTLIKKVKAERTATVVASHPAEDKMLKRNQIIRKRYADKAKQLKAKAATLPDKSEQTKFQRAAGLLEKHAKAMPVEANRGEKLHRQLDQKHGLPDNRQAQPTELIEKLNQYNAVTQGTTNEQGIYISPAEQMAQAMTATYFEAVEEQEQDEELEIDFDD